MSSIDFRLITSRLKNAKIADIAIFLMIFVMLAAADYKLIAVGTQVLCFLIIIFFQAHNRRRIMSYIIWYGLFLAYSLATYFWAYKTDTVLSCAFSILQVGLIGISVVVYANTSKKIEYIFKIFIVSAIVLSIRVMVEVPFTVWGNDRIGEYIGYNSNKLGYIFSYTAIFSYYLWHRFRKKIYILAIFPLSIFAFLTGSRKAFLLLILGILFISILVIKRRIILKVILLALLTVILYLIVINVEIFYNILGVRIESLVQTITGDIGDSSSRDRVYLMQEGVRLFGDRPLFGYGLDNFRYLNPLGLYAHNNYIEIAVNQGLVGLVIYYSLIFSLSIKVLKKIRHNLNYIISGVLLACILIMDIGMVSYSAEVIHLLIAIAFSVVINNGNESDESIKEGELKEL